MQRFGFNQPTVDECTFYKNSMVLIVYIGDKIFLGHINKQLEGIVVQEIKSAGFDMGDQGYPSEYVGVIVYRNANGTYQFTCHSRIILSYKMLTSKTNTSN